MFKAKIVGKFATNTDMVYTVYDVRTNKVGYPQFLVYFDNQWQHLSAKYFKPVKEEQ